tara:strand:- start:6242 stop:7087 length:846 start_codon:yes stop_codon:yes gene_type:complete
MKNIKYIALLLLSVTLLISCGEDDVDSVTNDGVFSPTSEISIGFIDTNDGQLVLESGGTVSFTIGLSVNPLSVDTEVTLGISSSDGTIDGATYPASVTIPAGSTTVDLDVTFADDGVAEGTTAETFTIEILNADFGGSTVFYLTAADINRTVDVVDTLPVIVVTTPSDVDFNFTWIGTSDLDIRIRDAGLNTIDTGYSVTPDETVTLGQGDADGVYTVSVRPWTVNDPTSDYTIEFVSPAGTETFTGTVTLTSGFWADEITVLEITKATNGTEVTYSFVEL